MGYYVCGLGATEKVSTRRTLTPQMLRRTPCVIISYVWTLVLRKFCHFPSVGL